jgi:LytS/YehU family sensor histidine kinase
MFLDRFLLILIVPVFRISVPWARFPHGLDLEYFFVMTAWTAGAAGLLLAERGRRLREEILESRLEHQATRLRLLAAQLNPHFLFNSLNTIKSLAAEDPTRAREVVTRLSSFLRQVIGLNAAAPTTVAQEMELCRDYLRVEEARFESGLSVSIDMAPRVESALVPPLIMQPLLENAILHGDPGDDGTRRVGVTARMDGDALVIEVSNTGAFDIEPSKRGVGLQLTRSRLEQMYGSHQRLVISDGEGTVSVSVVIESPKRADSTPAGS